MSRTFVYPANLTAEPDGSGFLFSFPDIPEAITDGDTFEEALTEAADALAEAIAGRINRGEEIPNPSSPDEGQPQVAVPAVMAAKAALYVAMKESGLSKVALAKQLGLDEKAVRRLLDPRHQSQLSGLVAAFRAMGKRLEVRLEDAA